MEIIIHSCPAERPKVAEALHQFAQAHSLPARAVQAADLALEEYLTNLTDYSFSGQPNHEIKVRLTVDPDLLIEVEDDGLPFNPLSVPRPDTTAPLADRPIGGLGIHLMRSFMDEVNYSTANGRNFLQMRKRL